MRSLNFSTFQTFGKQLTSYQILTHENDHSNPNNFRPMSYFSTFLTLTEKVILNKISIIEFQHKTIIDTQFDF